MSVEPSEIFILVLALLLIVSGVSSERALSECRQQVQTAQEITK